MKMLQAYDTMCSDNVVHGGPVPMFVYKTQKQQLLDLLDLVCNFVTRSKDDEIPVIFLAADWAKCHDRTHSLDFTVTEVL